MFEWYYLKLSIEVISWVIGLEHVKFLYICSEVLGISVEYVYEETPSSIHDRSEWTCIYLCV